MAEKRVVIELQLQDQNAVQRLGRLKVESNQVGQAIKQLNADIKAQGFATKEQTAALGELIARQKNLSGQSRELSNDLSGLTAAGMRFRDKMADASRAGLAAFGLNILSVTGAVTAMVSVFRSAVGIAADFDKAQSKLAAILTTTKDKITDLTDQAKQLGATTMFTASQVVDAQTELAKLGFNQKEIKNSTAALLDLASAAGTDIPNAATIAAETVKAFGLDAKDMQDVVDVMAKSFVSSSLDISKFSVAMSNVAPVAKTFGFDLRDTTTMLAQLSDAGFDASSAGTALRNILLNLADSNGALAQRLGGSVKSFDQLIPALQKLKSEGIDLNETLQLTDKRSVAAFNRFIDAADGAQVFRDALNDVSGTAREMARAQQDNLQGDKLKLTSAWEGFVISVLGESSNVHQALRGITQGFTSMLTAFTEAKGIGQFMDALIGNSASQINVAFKNAERAIADLAEKSKLSAQGLGDLEARLAKLTALRESFMKVGKVAEAQEGDAMIAKLQQEIALRKEAGEVVEGEARKEGSALKTIGSKREELTKQLEDYKKRREALDETDEDGLDTLNRQIKATQEAIAALDGKTKATTKQTAATKGLTEEQQALADQLLRLNELTQNPFKIKIEKEGVAKPEGPLYQEEVIEDDPFITGLPARLAAMEAEEIAFTELQVAKSLAVEGFASALGSMVDQGSEAAKVMLGVEKAAAAASVIVQASAAIAAATSAAASIPPILPPGVPNPAFFAAQAALPAQIAKIKISAAASLAMILAQAISGFKEGGYTSRKPSDSAPVGVVHANEYVIPAPIVRDPRYAPILRELEQARLRRGMPYKPNYYQSGGMVPSSLVAQADNTAALQRINFSPVVRVTDINNVQQTVKVIEQRATL